MREITHEELKQIQLGILDKVHEFCEKNGITYFLSSGTLIGAVRHKGYIPWDDDLDLYMPRADYDKFIKLFSANSPENTKLLSLETDKKYQYPFAKVIDDRTEMVETAVGESFKIGVYIDVFPVDSVPDNFVASWIVYWFLTIVKKFSLYCVFAQSKKSQSFSQTSFSVRKIIKFVFYPIFLVIPYRIPVAFYNL
ncbi:MAG: LicD family protein, partial [Opitutales bacterium]|nr:LicD family protein [Opitutales bacterium]